MLRSLRFTMIILLSALMGFSGAGFAKGKISRDEAVERIRSQMNGRVISAETYEWEGRQVHNIRLLSKDGRVKRFRIDSETGRQLKRSKKR